MAEAHFRGLERLYHSARCNEYYDPRLTVDQGEARVAIELREDFHHAMDAVHGSVYMKALDDAAFFAANSLIEEVFVLTAGLHVEFLRPVTQGELVATGRVVNQGRRRIVAEATAEHEGNEIARALGTFMTSQQSLDESEAYRGD